MFAARIALVLALVAPCEAYWHGWRDQHVRVSPQLSNKVQEQSRRHLAQGTSFSEELKEAAKRVMRSAEQQHHRRIRGCGHMALRGGAHHTQ